MIRIAIVDDEKIFVEAIQRETEHILKDRNLDFEITGFTNGELFLTEHKITRFDLVLLDIDMPDLNGFAIAEMIGDSRIKSSVIFISQFSNLVFDSFHYSPLKFVRKNNIHEDLPGGIDLFLKRMQSRFDEYQFSFNNTTEKVPVRDIVYFESMKHVIQMLLKSGKKIQLKQNRAAPITITGLQETLTGKGFIRVHKSYLINYKYIQYFTKNAVVLNDESQIQINAKNMNAIKREYQDLLMEE